MSDSPILPGAHAWRDGSGKPLPVEFYRFLRDLIGYLKRTGASETAIAELEARVTALEQGGLSAAITGPLSVRVLGSLSDGEVALQLVGDSLAPGALAYYGTDALGAKGWYQRLLATLADVDVSTPPAPGDALVFDGTNWAPAQVAPPQDYTRITAEGDVRITADGDIRITD